MTVYNNAKKILFAKCSHRGDPRKGYWLDWVTVLIAVFIVVNIFTRWLPKSALRLLYVAAELWLLLPLIDILPNVFNPELVRQQTEPEHKTWRIAALDRVYSFLGGLLWAIFIF